MKKQPFKHSALRHEISRWLHPYIFALKEGRQFNQNYLDYSLLLMQVNCSERLASPAKDPLKRQ